MLRVSGGPGLAAVPNVEGDEEAAATAELQRADFEVDTRQEASSDVNEGVVISQSPDGRLAGRGRQHRDHRRVERARDRGGPGRPQRSLDSAEATLNGAGLVVGNVTEEPSSRLRRGHGHPPGPRADGPAPRGLARSTWSSPRRRSRSRSRRSWATRPPTPRPSSRTPASTSQPWRSNSAEPGRDGRQLRPPRGHPGRPGQHDHHQRQPRLVRRRPRQPRRGRGRRRQRLRERRRAAAPAVRAA